MAIFKCKMCGGSLEIVSGASVIECEYCGTQQTLPKLDDERRANMYDRANHFRRNNEFDKAMGIYESILNEDSSDAEAYWSLVLCRYGIEYVEDPSSHKRIPTVNRAQFTSIFDDNNFKSAIQYADSHQKALYEAEANAINEIQKGILAISQKEEPFDVFICYKETDHNGRRTPDSVLANDLYHQLTQEGFKVFFSRITLEDKLGSAYEPYIFAALNSAKVMVVLGTKPEHFNAVWVKNEWSRYLALIKQGQKKMLIPAYKDIDPYDLPDEFSHLQAQDMSKLGFMQDLIRGIKKIALDDAPKTTIVKETTVSGGSANTAPLLERAFMFLEDGDWNSANEYCEKVLDIEPKNAEAYLGKLMAELRVRKQDKLKDCSTPFDGLNNFEKAVRFGDEKLKEMLTGCIEHINARNEKARLDGIYNKAKSAMAAAKTEKAFKEAAKQFESIAGHMDASALAKDCHEKAESARKDAILEKANAPIKGESLYISEYEEAISYLKTIPGWKNADELIGVCKNRIDEIKAQKEAERLEQERKEEQRRKEAEKKKKKNKKIVAITIPCVCAIATFVVLLFTVFIPNSEYNDAKALMDEGKYNEAITAFVAMDGYRDSENKIDECNALIIDGKYNDAIALMNDGEYSNAISAFKALKGYKNSASMIDECRYLEAVSLMDAGIYTKAIPVFERLGDYKDSAAKIDECNTLILDGKYNDAMALMDEGKYDEAMSAFEALDGHKNSADKIVECETIITEDKYNNAVALLDSGKIEDAYDIFTEISDYRDVADYLKCFVFIPESITIEWDNPGMNTIMIEYDSQLNMIGSKLYDGKNIAYEYKFDSSGRLASLIILSHEDMTTTYTSLSDGTVERTRIAPKYNSVCTYDVYGHHVSSVEYYKSGEIKYKGDYSDYTYDSHHNLINKYIRNEYDQNGNLISVTDTLGTESRSYVEYKIYYSADRTANLDLIWKNIRIMGDGFIWR